MLDRILPCFYFDNNLTIYRCACTVRVPFNYSSFTHSNTIFSRSDIGLSWTCRFYYLQWRRVPKNGVGAQKYLFGKKLGGLGGPMYPWTERAGVRPPLHSEATPLITCSTLALFIIDTVIYVFYFETLFLLSVVT